MTETCKSIGEWADATFGRCATPQRAITRALKELAELQDAYDLGADAPTLLIEAADVAICLMRFCHQFGGELQEHIDAKMAVNRLRQWKLDGSGNAQHVEELAL